MYLLSIDGGGTKTQMCVYNLDDKSTAIFDFGNLNYHDIGIEKFEEVFLGAIDEIYEALEISSKDITGMVMGLSGLDTKEDKTLIEPVVVKTGISRENIFLCNDAELIMYSCTSVPGICVVAGTGSVAFGYDESFEVIRCGGLGSPLSDLGSGYWIGSQILREYIKYTDDQVPYLSVFDEIETYYKKRRYELLETLKYPSKKTVAHVAKLVLENAKDGDPLCEMIVNGAVYNLANLVATIYKKLDTSDALKIDVCMTGSIFKSDLLAEQFKEQCKIQTGYNNFNFIKLSIDPAEAGIVFAKAIFCK